MRRYIDQLGVAVGLLLIGLGFALFVVALSIVDVVGAVLANIGSRARPKTV